MSLVINSNNFIVGVTDKYPEELLNGRLTIEGNLVALLFKDPSLYDDIGSDINEQTMLTKSGRFLFSLGKLLKDKGYNVFDEVTVYSVVPEEIKDRLDGIGGWKAVQKLTSVVNEDNSDAIIDAINKSNVLLRLYESGFNVNKEITVKGNKTTPVKLFERWDTQSVLSWYEEKIANCGVDVRSDIIEDEGYVDFNDSFLDGLKKGKERGISIASAGTDVKGEIIDTFRFLDSDLRGLKPGTLNAIGGASGTGKSTIMLNIVMSLASQGVKTVIINNEMKKSDYMIMILCWILYKVFHYTNLTRGKLSDGDLSEEDLDMIHKAREYYQQNYGKYIKIVTLTDANMKLSLQIAKKEILRNGMNCVVIDTFKITMDGEDSKNSNFWMQLIEDSRAYNKLCSKYNIIGLMTIQLAINAENQLFLSANCLSMSKQIKEILSVLLLCRPLKSYEREAGSPYDIRAFRSKKNEETGEWTEAPYRLDPNENYTVLFRDKNRRGVDSGSDGIAYLLKQRLRYGVFSESSKCRPTHKRADNV